MLRFLFLTIIAALIADACAQHISLDSMKMVANERMLPYINLTYNVDSITKDSFIRGNIELMEMGDSPLEDLKTKKYDCMIRYRGASSINYEKKSYAIKLINDKGDKLNANILGIRNDNSWILDAMAIDRARMRNRICFDLWNEFSGTPYHTKYDNRNGTKGKFVEVFINGYYNGLYCLSDKIDRKLLDLNKDKNLPNEEPTVHGILYKGIYWTTGIDLLSYETDSTNKKTWNSWELQYPDDYPSLETWQPLMDLIDFCSYKTSDNEFTNNWKNYFYEENLIDFYTFVIALNIGDTPYKNSFLSLKDINKEHRFLITPWDMDMSLGGLYNGDYDESLTDIYRITCVAPFHRLFTQNIDGFKDKVKDRYEELSKTIFSVDHITELLHDYSQQLEESGAWSREYERWNGNPVELKESIFEEIDYIIDWYKNNANSILPQFYIDEKTIITDIEKADYFNIQTPITIYKLDGRRINYMNLQDLPSGLYIINGKKIFITGYHTSK